MCSSLISIVILNLDEHIHKFVEWCCFDIYKSRRYKFQFLFVWIGLSVILILLYNFLLLEYSIKAIWLESKCLQRTTFKYRLGLDYTYLDFTVISIIVGAVFGCCYASTHIDGFLYQSTSRFIRFFRALIGVIFVAIARTLILLIPIDNYCTDFFLIRAIPYCIITYCIFGYYPYIWSHIGFIEIEESDDTMVINYK